MTAAIHRLSHDDGMDQTRVTEREVRLKGYLGNKLCLNRSREKELKIKKL